MTKKRDPIKVFCQYPEGKIEGDGLNFETKIQYLDYLKRNKLNSPGRYDCFLIVFKDGGKRLYD